MICFCSVRLFCFSNKPLGFAISLGCISILIVLALVLWILDLHIFVAENVMPGWSSTVIIILFLGGVQLFTIGILGEYIGNIFDETKNRPEYIICKKINLDETK